MNNSGYIKNTNVTGYSIRVTWGAVNPGDGVYDWSKIDTQLSKALSLEAAKGKTIPIMLRVIGGTKGPSWLISGATPDIIFTFTDNDGNTKEILLPWSDRFNNKIAKFIKALGNRYSSDTRIKFIHLMAPVQDSAEMYLPNTWADIQNWKSKATNYNQLILDSWKYCMAQTASVFPNQKMCLNVAKPVDDYSIIYNLIDYGISTYGVNAICVQMNSLHATTSDTFESYVIVKSYYNTTINGFQTLCPGNYTNCGVDPRCFGTPYRDAYKHALNAGADYIEIIPSDLDDFPADCNWGRKRIINLDWNQLPNPAYTY